MNNQRFEYASVEWLWDSSNLRCNLPNGEEFTRTGTYGEVVTMLTELGSEGWDVASCVANSNWLYWTLKRVIS
ncbi:hypothetical protein [uncultured Microscilla sp.]|uniref:hypothetical protein n=1 Tax=uncultured Microscilla sp. TaxID=432653 RepID=UPI002636EC0C|nr:hypothetical protein [uncultured Microscilla sp.]